MATKWHPNKAEMKRLCALVEDRCLNHFKNILKKKRSSVNFGQIFDFSFSKETGQLLKKRRLTLNKIENLEEEYVVKTLCTYFRFNCTKCIIYFQYNSVKIVSFSFYLPFSFIQFGSCSSQPLVMSFCPFIVCFLLFYKTYL